MYIFMVGLTIDIGMVYSNLSEELREYLDNRAKKSTSSFIPESGHELWDKYVLYNSYTHLLDISTWSPIRLLSEYRKFDSIEPCDQAPKSVTYYGYIKYRLGMYKEL